MLDFAAQYEAFERRDPALDGVVFVAVKTTGIYCRPVCRARTPLERGYVLGGPRAVPARSGHGMGRSFDSIPMRRSVGKCCEPGRLAVR